MNFTLKEKFPRVAQLHAQRHIKQQSSSLAGSVFIIPGHETECVVLSVSLDKPISVVCLGPVRIVKTFTDERAALIKFVSLTFESTSGYAYNWLRERCMWENPLTPTRRYRPANWCHHAELEAVKAPLADALKHALAADCPALARKIRSAFKSWEGARRHLRHRMMHTPGVKGVGQA